MTDKMKAFSTLLKIHDAIYAAIEILDDTTATGPQLVKLGTILEHIESAEQQLEMVLGSNWWKKDE